MRNRRQRGSSRAQLWLLLVLPVALALRLLWVYQVDTAPVYDFLKYHEGALSIAQGKGYQLYGKPTAFEPIGYPGFLALLYILFEPRIMVPKLANVALSMGIIILSYLLGQKWFHKGVGVLAAALVAFSPRNIVYTSVLANEIFFTFFLLLVLVLITYQGQKAWSGPVVGVFCGILALTKPFMLVFPGVLFFILWLWQGGFTASLKKAALITLFMVLTICPWTIRNYLVFGEFIPISTNGGITLYLNNNPYANGHWQDPFQFPNSPLAPYKDEETGFWDELAVDKLGKKLAVQWILENPADFIALGFKKLYYIYNDAWDVYYAVEFTTDGRPLPHRGWVYKTARYAYWGLLASLGLYLLMLVKAARRRESLRGHLLVFLNLLFFSGIYFCFEGQPRYLFPLLPLLCMLASWGLREFVGARNQY